MELKTPIYEWHVKCEGKMVPFAGYILPVQYKSGLITEHNTVRQKAGMFDVSHMSEIFVEGKDALKNIQNIFANDFSTMNIGQIKYTVMLNENGGIMDDMIIYKMGEEKFLIVGNAANREKDFNWIKEKTEGEAKALDKSDEYAQIALQGPLSVEILKTMMKEEDIPQKYYYFNENVLIEGMECILSQTGYTGELGFEIYTKSENGPKLWEVLLEKGKDFGLIPCGLGARDTLRLEAGMPLYGHEMNDEISPLEAGLSWSVKMNKGDFIGKDALLKRGEPDKKLVGLKVTGRGIVREDCEILLDGTAIGKTTSGTHAPFLGYPIASGYVCKNHSEIGTAVKVNVRGREIEAEVIKMPFYKR